jgi:transposase InsO family protein
VACRALDQWAFEHGVELRLIQPGKPTQNGFIESFRCRFAMNGESALARYGSSGKLLTTGGRYKAARTPAELSGPRICRDGEVILNV